MMGGMYTAVGIGLLGRSHSNQNQAKPNPNPKIKLQQNRALLLIPGLGPGYMPWSPPPSMACER